MRRLPPWWLIALAVAMACLPYNGAVHADAIGLAPSGDHPLGTDALGRDVALRLFAGLRPLALGGGVALLVALGLGVPLGALAGARSGLIAQAVRAPWIALACVPAIPLTLLLGLVLGHGAAPLGLAWGLASVPGVLEAIRQRVDALRREERLLALVTHGIPEPVAVARHLVANNARDVIVVQSARITATFLAMESALSYLGRAGVAEPAASWGNMLAMAVSAGPGANPMAVAAPAVTIMAVAGALWWSALGPARSPPPSTQLNRKSAEAGLRVEQLELRTADRVLTRQVDFAVAPGTVSALIGPSGSGKSLLLRAVAGILPPEVWATGTVVSGPLAWVSQDGRVSLDPLRTIRAQVDATPANLMATGFPPERLNAWPHTLSGGEAQRAALLLALSGERATVLLADEPTTGLDPRARRELTDRLRTLASHGTGVLFVTHDLRLLPGFAAQVYAIGRDTQAEPKDQDHPPDVQRRPAARVGGPAVVGSRPLPPSLHVEVSELDVYAGLTRRPRTPRGGPVIRGLNLTVAPGETVGIIGESGVGKTTLLRAIAGLCASRGSLRVLGTDPRAGRIPGLQVLWQDPSTSLDPAMPLEALLEISARLGPGRSVREALGRVGLTHRAAARSGDLSGGERRRASLAQIWLSGAQLVLADEPTAALDGVRSAQALRLLRELVGPEGAILLASHDLGLVLPLCDRVYVLHEGACIDVFGRGEEGTLDRHAFTRALLDCP